jgi:DNA-binding MarR family transcriptional regulator
VHDTYVGMASLVGRIHRQVLEVIKVELEALRVRDINSVQGLMLFNIGDAEMPVSEVTLRGCYLGSNVSYNLRKMVENGYLSQERSVHDRRTIHVRATEKGAKLCGRLQMMHQRHIELLKRQTEITDEDLQSAIATLQRLDRFLDRIPDAGAPGRGANLASTGAVEQSPPKAGRTRGPRRR